MRTPLRATLAAAAAIISVLGMTGVADADKHKPIPTKAQVEAAQNAAKAKAGDVAAIRAELVVARTKLEKAAERAEVAAEAYNGARWRLQEATDKAAKAAAAANAAAKKVADQRAGIAALATQSFQNASELTGVSAYLGSGGPQQVADEITITQSVNDTLQSQYDAYAAADSLAKSARATADAAKRDQAAATAKAEEARNQAAAAATSAQTEATAIAQQRNQLIVELARAQKISVALATQRQNGLEELAQERAAKAAAAKARAEAAAAAAAQAKADAANANKGTGGGGSGSGASSSDSDHSEAPPPASGSAAARAIAFAKAQLGEMYLWAAAGPDRWDCSGLTMMAWRAGGVSLPHYSAAQYAESTPVSVNDLRPGDLVFWGDSPGSIHHVAMYIGNGEIIHAPRTGRPVEIDSMYYWVPPNYFARP